MGARPGSDEWKAAEKLADAAKKDENSDETTQALFEYMDTPKDDR